MSKSSARPRRNLLGSQIRQLRKAKGWSQADMARQLQLKRWDIERTMLTKIELQRRCLTDYEVITIAQVLGTTLNELLPQKMRNLREYFDKAQV